MADDTVEQLKAAIWKLALDHANATGYNAGLIWLEAEEKWAALIAAVRAETAQEIAWRDKRMAWYAHLTEVRGFMR